MLNEQWSWLNLIRCILRTLWSIIRSTSLGKSACIFVSSVMKTSEWWTWVLAGNFERMHQLTSQTETLFCCMRHTLHVRATETPVCYLRHTLHVCATETLLCGMRHTLHVRATETLFCCMRHTLHVRACCHSVLNVYSQGAESILCLLIA